MMTNTSLFQRLSTDAPFSILEEPETLHRRIAHEIGKMEKSGWAVRQIMQIQDHHAFFVVFEWVGEID